MSLNPVYGDQIKYLKIHKIDLVNSTQRLHRTPNYARQFFAKKRKNFFSQNIKVPEKKNWTKNTGKSRCQLRKYLLHTYLAWKRGKMWTGNFQQDKRNGENREKCSTIYSFKNRQFLGLN